MSDVIIIQRVVTHYREALFAGLWKEFGWKVVTARNPPKNTFLHLIEEDREYITRFDFEFPDPQNAYRSVVPVGQILRETGAKAVIAEFSLRMNSTYELVLRRRLARAPVTLFWSHGYNMDRGLHGVGALVQAPRILLSRLADGHIVYSAEGKAFLDRWMNPDRVIVARNSLGLQPSSGTSDGGPSTGRIGKPALVTVGRMTIDKNFPGLVRVFKAFLQYHPAASLTIVGDGPDADRTRKTAGGLLGKSIFMTGAIYDENRIANYYQASDLAVFSGAVGLSVNHALLYGVPVMAFEQTRVGPHHHPEIAYVVDGITGVRVRPYTEAAMVTALSNFFVRHPDPKMAFRSSIIKYVDENLTLDVMIEDFRKVRDLLYGLGVKEA